MDLLFRVYAKACVGYCDLSRSKVIGCVVSTYRGKIKIERYVPRIVVEKEKCYGC
jgi:hypothetical protein